MKPKSELEKEFERVLDKAKIIGGYDCVPGLRACPTACGHECFIYSPSNQDHIIYVPDAVTRVYSSKYSHTMEPHEEDSNFRDLLGTVKVIGGHNLTDCYGLFYSCKAKKIDLSELDTSNVISMAFMFAGCFNLKSVDLQGLDTSNVKNMSYMFAKCTYLTDVDVSGLPTGNVYDFSYMFFACHRLRELNVSGLDTKAAKTTEGMFAGCSFLKVLDVNAFDVLWINYCWNMLYGCKALKFKYQDIHSPDWELWYTPEWYDDKRKSKWDDMTKWGFRLERGERDIFPTIDHLIRIARMAEDEWRGFR